MPGAQEPLSLADDGATTPFIRREALPKENPVESNLAGRRQFWGAHLQSQPRLCVLPLLQVKTKPGGCSLLSAKHLGHQGCLGGPGEYRCDSDPLPWALGADQQGN